VSLKDGGGSLPFYIRKSISAGPFRFNLSKSGVGLSVGVKGLRVGTGPRGHYVHAGLGGLYYRSSLGPAGQSPKTMPPPAPHALPADPASQGFYHPTVDMFVVESGDVMEMADSRFQDILDDLNGRADQVRMSHALGGAGLVIWLFAMLIAGFGASLGFLILAGIGWAVGAWIDSYRRSSVVYYDVSDEAFKNYQALITAFDGMSACAGKWHVAAGGAVCDLHTWKTNAGASHIVSKSATALLFQLPSVLKSNITPPSIGVGKQRIYFLPDVALLEHGRRFGAIAYRDLKVSFQDSRFIEEGAVPRDALVVDHTWRYVNKKGGPDRRFNDNRQIPICLYEAMHLRSGSGLNELVEFSRRGVSASFVAAVEHLGASLNPSQAGRATVGLPR
jgi:hypothetical protein